MKKVKIMLSAVLAIAIVGGALAFKAKTTQAFCFYAKASQSGLCTTVTKYLPSDAKTTITELSGDFNKVITLVNIDDDCAPVNEITCDQRRTTVVGE